MNIMIVNGPNLNFLGIREPEVYGKESYEDLYKLIKGYAKEKQFKFKMYQTNYEGDIIELIQYAYVKHFDAIILNPGAFTHYSYAIYDAIKSVTTPTIEVHLSDITKREDFRKVSILSPVCQATFMGNHFRSYLDAIDYVLKENKNA